MELNYLYFREEVRDGFYVSGFMKRFWAAQMEVLKDFDNFCKKYDLKWFATYGTLLGAVRHKGFIPWDDDIDICMLREDYDRFLELAKENLPENCHIKTNFLEGSSLVFLTRFYNSERITLDERILNKYHGCPLSVGIDIFVLDNVSDDEKEEKIRKECVLNLLSHLKEVAEDDSKEELRKEILAELVNAEKLFADRKTKKVSFVIEGTVHTNEKPCDRECFDKIISIPFEYMNINAPSGYDEYLQMLFGDYMTVVKNSAGHNYPAYKKNKQVFIDALEGGSPFTFKYKLEDFTSDNRNGYDKLVAIMDKYVTFLAKISEDMSNNKDVSDLLVSAQNMAISIGNSLEGFLGEGSEPVSYLEKSCEILFNLYQFYAGEDIALAHEVEEFVKNQKEIIKYVEQWKNRNKVVILVSFDDDIDKAEELYTSLISKNPEGKNITVIGIPHFERNMNGSLATKHYLTKKSKLFDIINCEESGYNLKSEHPGVIYTFYGFDQRNETNCIDPKYFTSVIRDYTSELVYIQPFETDEIYDGDNIMKVVMDEYVNIPAFVYADKVVVQSENTKNKYVDYWWQNCINNCSNICTNNEKNENDSKIIKDIIANKIIPKNTFYTIYLK